MMRFGIYLAGLLLVLAAIWVLLTQTGLAAVVPVGVIVVILLAIFGFGLMGASRNVEETLERQPHEVVETRQQVGDTEIRRSKLL